jgi:hypothetical protein
MNCLVLIQAAYADTSSSGPAWTVSPTVTLTQRSQFRFDLANRAQQAGEPSIRYFNTADLSSQMRSLGFAHLFPLLPKYINRRCFADRSDRFRVGGKSRLMLAKLKSLHD